VSKATATIALISPLHNLSGGYTAPRPRSEIPEAIG
jgi:hypothetical protein